VDTLEQAWGTQMEEFEEADSCLSEKIEEFDKARAAMEEKFAKIGFEELKKEMAKATESVEDLRVRVASAEGKVDTFQTLMKEGFVNVKTGTDLAQHVSTLQGAFYKEMDDHRRLTGRFLETLAVQNQVLHKICGLPTLQASQEKPEATTHCPSAPTSVSERMVRLLPTRRSVSAPNATSAPDAIDPNQLRGPHTGPSEAHPHTMEGIQSTSNGKSEESEDGMVLDKASGQDAGAQQVAAGLSDEMMTYVNLPDDDN
jgi:hypothetical protein